MRSISRKTLSIIIAAVVVLAGAGIAYAYWTAGGTGAGDAQTGTNAAIVVVQTSVVTNMAPGNAPQTLSGNFNNTTNTGPVFVNTVTASIGGVTKAVGAPTGVCDATDYTLVNPVMTVNAQVPTGTGVGAWTGATIQFNNKTAVNQDACKGATVNLVYVIA